MAHLSTTELGLEYKSLVVDTATSVVCEREIFGVPIVSASCSVRAVNAIRELLKEARERKRWSQSDLARAIGLRPQSVQSWESGRQAGIVEKVRAFG